MPQSSRVRSIALAAVVLFLLAGVAAWHFGLIPISSAVAPGNSIVIIMPYRYGATWVFDDAQAGLVREPFVGGVPQMIDVLVTNIPDAASGFRLYFSAAPFPGYQKKLTWTRGNAQGNYYHLDAPPMEGWLCPSLLKYYPGAPKELYVKAEPKG